MGSNLGNRERHLAVALERLARAPGVEMLACSPILETDPIGPQGQGAYLNAVCTVATTRSPLALLRLLRRIEATRGRDRVHGKRWGPRTLDLDLLLYADRVIGHPLLSLPHARLHERLFVLEPLAAIAPEWVVPTLGRSVADLLEVLQREATHRQGENAG